MFSANYSSRLCVLSRRPRWVVPLPFRKLQALLFVYDVDHLGKQVGLIHGQTTSLEASLTMFDGLELILEVQMTLLDILQLTLQGGYRLRIFEIVSHKSIDT